MKAVLYSAILFLIFDFSANELFAQSNDYTYHKAFVEDESRIYHVVEFKESGIYIDEKRAVLLKVFTGVVLADFEDINERFFVVVTNVTQGTCGYSEFAIVSISEKMNVKASVKSPNNQCFGESPEIYFLWNKEDQRIISISGYEYNLSTGKWNVGLTKKTKKRNR